MPLSDDPTLLSQRRTKIIATLGPASNDSDSIAQLIAAGVNVFRLNMSHGDHEQHRRTSERVRECAEAVHAPVAILVDLCGPKIRVGRFTTGGIELTEGEQVTVTTRDVLGGPGLIPTRYAAFTTDVSPPHRVLCDDGRIELRVEAVEGEDARCTVVHGGTLTDNKGMNLPDGELSVPALTPQDREDARFAVEQRADFLALSFVRRGADIDELRGILPTKNSMAIVAKIERPEALQNVDEILAASDAIMVARGDLGIELPLESIPGTQDGLVDAARREHIPVIIATQMLDSMIRNARPTRAEVADIAHAVASGADAVMLSGETAVGAHPVGSVAIMDRVIRHTEGRLWNDAAFRSLTLADTKERPMPLGDAFGRAVSRLSRDLGVRTILVISRSGASGRMLSSARPAAPLLAVTGSARTSRLLSMCWGVVPVLVRSSELEAPVPLLRRLVRSYDLADRGQHGLIVQGFLTDARETKPSVTVITI